MEATHCQHSWPPLLHQWRTRIRVESYWAGERHIDEKIVWFGWAGLEVDGVVSLGAGIGRLREGEYNLWLSKENAHLLSLVSRHNERSRRVYDDEVSGAGSTHLGKQRWEQGIVWTKKAEFERKEKYTISCFGPIATVFVEKVGESVMI